MSDLDITISHGCGCVSRSVDGAKTNVWCSEHAVASPVDVRPGAVTALAAELAALKEENARLVKRNVELWEQVKATDHRYELYRDKASGLIDRVRELEADNLARHRAYGELHARALELEMERDAYIAKWRESQQTVTAETDLATSRIADLTMRLEKAERRAAAIIDKCQACGAPVCDSAQCPAMVQFWESRANKAVAERDAAVQACEAMRGERDELIALVNTPEVIDFVMAVQLEAAHQRKRWPSDHDASKTDADWFWLIGYLAGKALHNPIKSAESDQQNADELQLHRIITIAAATANWHAAKLGKMNSRLGVGDVALATADNAAGEGEKGDER